MLEKKGSILLVEDDIDLASSIEMKLNQLGFQVQICAKVSEAIFKLRNQKYDCILLDLHLKEGHGEKVLHYIRTDDKDPNHLTPVIVTSGNLDRGFVQEHGKVVSGMLVKPFDGPTLLARIESAIESRKEQIAAANASGKKKFYG